MSYIDEHIDYLAGHEGIKGASERVEDSTKTAAPYGLDNPPISRTKKESDRTYVKRVLEHFEAKARTTLGDAYDNAPTGVKRAILDSYYNSGRLYPGQIASLKGTNGVSDYVGFAKNTLDIVSANDSKTNSAGILKGLANRKAATYNLMANEVEGLSPITGGELIDVEGKAQLIYNTGKDPYTYNFNKPLHSKSKAGPLNVKAQAGYKNAPGVNSYEQYMQAAENENAALMPNFGAPKVAAAPEVRPNFKVAGGYNPNKAAENVMSQYGKRPKEVIKETETITEDIPLLQRAKTGLTSLGSYFKNFEKGGPVNLEEYMQAVENSNKDLIPVSLPNFYANENITPPRDGTYTLLPEEIITPYQDDTIMEEEIITQPPQYSMQEAARRSMMLGNGEERMADYENAQYNPQQNSSYALPQMQAAQRMMGGGMGYAQGGTVDQAQGLASLGRGGDSTLVHMQPREVAGLQQLAQSNGTSLTRNPMTGYPEAFSLGGVLKAAAPIAAGYFTGGAATFAGLGAGSGAIAAGAATGAGLAAATGDDVIMGGITGGMGGMSGGGLEGALMGSGTVPGAIPGSTVNPALVSAPVTSTPLASAGSFNPALDSTLSTGGGGAAPLTQGSVLDPKINPGASFDDTLGMNTGSYEIVKRPFDASGQLGEFREFKPGNFLDKAKALGSPVASLGIGGLEESDFINEPDFNDPRDKYDPRSKLNLSRDTGISEAMSRDTGLRLLARGGYLQGPGDGMSDDIPATINGDEPAALADGEFVIPADVVSHIGNGSSEAGSKQLYAMMNRIRKARTGRESQGKEINPGKYMPT